MALSTETLRGRLAVVTGAGRGIGLCFCHALAERGCNLVMISNQRDDILDIVCYAFSALLFSICSNRLVFFSCKMANIASCGKSSRSDCKSCKLSSK